jgi:hypothetical protein
MQPAQTMEDMNILGVSPPASPEPRDPSEEVSHERVHKRQKQQAVQADQGKPVGLLLQAQREWPFFTSLKSCLWECDLRWVTTTHGGVNNCLLYSYSVASGEMHHKEQNSRCALLRPTHTLWSALTANSCVRLQEKCCGCPGVALHCARGAMREAQVDE